MKTSIINYLTFFYFIFISISITQPFLENWPSFRGPNASGLSNSLTPIHWDIEKSIHLKWHVSIPGLAHSCPIIWGKKLFVTTVVSERGNTSMKTGLFGDIQSIQDESIHEWVLFCLDRNTGKILWKKVVHRGIPKIKRHPKSTHANSTPATDGKHVVAFFGSEGLYCFDMNGNLLWQKDFGVLDAAFYRVPQAQWGFASSPIIHDGVVIIQSDVLENSFLGAYDVTKGEELWRTSRSDVPTWCTPTIYTFENNLRIAVNGYKCIAGYDFQTGQEIWRMGEGGDIPVPAPVIWGDLLFFTSGHGKLMPIYAVNASAKGNISLTDNHTSNQYVVWSVPKEGAYIPTPIVVEDYLYRLQDRGEFSCFNANDGELIYTHRFQANSWFIASPVASRNAIYCIVEKGTVFVVKPGGNFELLAKLNLNDNCLATPAISDGVIYFRTQHQLMAISE